MAATARTFRPQLQALVGDLAYADGYLARWDFWGSAAAPLLSGIPTIACHGNHEVGAHPLPPPPACLQPPVQLPPALLRAAAAPLPLIGGLLQRGTPQPSPLPNTSKPHNPEGLFLQHHSR